MKVFDDFRRAGIPRAAVIGIGNFDGVHLGHQAVIAAVREGAGREGVPAGILTFHPHTQSIVGLVPPLLYTQAEKETILASLGVELLVNQTFDREIAGWSPRTFVEQVLVGRLAPRGIVVGVDFRFGRGGVGTAATLRRAGQAAGFDVTSLEEVRIGGQPVRSSRIRELLQVGRVEEAALLLGRPFHFTGTVIKGRGLGREIGFPTANLEPPDKLLPADGVYAGRAVVEGTRRLAAVNIGSPTVGEERRRLVEIFILDYDASLYGRSLEVEFLSRIRDERPMSDLADLARQLAADVAAVRRNVKEREP